MKYQDNCSPSKGNHTTKNLNTCVEEEISNTECQETIVKMINELKEETQKLVPDLKDNVNKQLGKYRQTDE
jgi:hypothetical protein